MYNILNFVIFLTSTVSVIFQRLLAPPEKPTWKFPALAEPKLRVWVTFVEGVLVHLWVCPYALCMYGMPQNANFIFVFNSTLLLLQLL